MERSRIMSPIGIVPVSSIVFMVLALLISIGIPVFLTIFFYKKFDISIIAVFVGALVFFVIQIILRISVFLPITQKTAWYNGLSNDFKLLFLGFTAGLFEEPGRLLGFKLFLKNRLSWKNGIAYAVGHGGIEAIMITGMANVNNLIMSSMINSGIFDKSIAPLLPEGQAEYIKNALVSTPPVHFLLGGIERIFAMGAHIAFSILVLTAVKKRNSLYLLAAIGLHTILNVVAAVLAGKSIWIAEGFLLVAAVGAVYFAYKARELFDEH